MIKIGDTVKILKEKRYNAVERKYPPVGSICIVKDKNLTTSGLMAYGVEEIGDNHMYYYLAHELEKGHCEWIPEPVPKFNWSCDSRSDLENWINVVRSEKEHDEYGFITCLRCGELAFDLEEKLIDGDNHLFVELYVGGIDSGYGYSMNHSNKREEYPYDHCVAGSKKFKFTFNAITADELIEWLIPSLEDKILYIDENNLYPHCSLQKKASKELRVF